MKNNWTKLKRSTMKPTKKKPAKRAVVKGSIEHKLLQLYNRIDETQTSEPKHIDLQWVWSQLLIINMIHLEDLNLN